MTWRARQDRFLTERHFQNVAKDIKEDRMTKVESVYSTFEAIEEEVAHCYFILQERFITQPRLARFWAEAALDELQHASILRYCREHRLFEAGAADGEMAEGIDDLLDTVKGIVGDPHVTADDAFFAALLIESSELDDVYEKLTRPLAKDHPLLHQAVSANLRSHLDTFADGAAEFTNNRAYVDSFRGLGRGEKRAQ
jgi:hypothetical protein